jgi:uncharacterized membrane protein HdeD (DUF308 family)
MNNAHEAFAEGVPFEEGARHQRGLLITIGIVTILAGVAAIIVPRMATLAIELLIGAVLVVDGVLQGIHAFQLREGKESWWRGLGALLAFAVGLILLFFPLQGILTLTLLIGIFFLLSGGFKIMLAFQVRSWSGWGWILTSGIISLFLGLLVFLLWPEGARWMIGVLVGVDLVFGGWWLIALGGMTRKGEVSS